MSNNLRADHLEFVHFGLEHAADEPMPRRARLYRAAAELLPEVEAMDLIERAAELEAADQRCRDFIKELEQRKSKGSGNGGPR